MHRANCFVTLTYADEFLPPDYSVDVRVHQLFLKRLRKRFAPQRFRFYLCGEYGELNRRPHYHACLFGLDMPDKRLWKMTDDGPLFTSQILDQVWGFGFTTLGAVTFKSAAYTARYVMKKVTGDRAEKHYQVVHPISGQVVQQRPEYTKMSLKPGIGTAWFEKYKNDVYPDDFIIVNGRKVRPPKYYDVLLERVADLELRQMKRRRILRGKKHSANNTRDRLRVREVVQRARINRLKRSI